MFSYYGFYKCAQLLLQNNAKTEIKEMEVRTPLLHTALNGHLELCQLLLKHGANPITPFEGNPIISECAQGWKPRNCQDTHRGWSRH